MFKRYKQIVEHLEIIGEICKMRDRINLDRKYALESDSSELIRLYIHTSKNRSDLFHNFVFGHYKYWKVNEVYNPYVVTCVQKINGFISTETGNYEFVYETPNPVSMFLTGTYKFGRLKGDWDNIFREMDKFIVLNL